MAFPLLLLPPAVHQAMPAAEAGDRCLDEVQRHLDYCPMLKVGEQMKRMRDEVGSSRLSRYYCFLLLA